MSSISITPMTFELRRPAAAVRLTRRGRVVFLVAFIAVAVFAMVAMSGLADAGSPHQVRYIQVAPGQTLTEIAQQVGGSGDIRDTIAEIEQMNGMSGAALQAGQRLALPVR
ncbi:MAG: LysM peptidoglycan-binding domain-containing protein [Marmoricola sp.]